MFVMGVVRKVEGVEDVGAERHSKGGKKGSIIDGSLSSRERCR